MATVAAVATAAAAVGSAAYQASGGGGGKGGGGVSGPAGPGLGERLFNRGTRDILNEERGVLENALAAGNAIQPELYKALGLEPQYDGPAVDTSALSKAKNDYHDQLDSVNNRITEIFNTKGFDPNTSHGKLRKELTGLRRQQHDLMRNINSVEEQLGRASEGRKIIGFKRIDGIPDPTNSDGGGFAGVLNEYDAHLEAALKGQAPIDPTLQHQYDLEEQNLREGLRRQFGPDYESSTAGQQALQAFDQRKAEAFAAYNTNAITTYSGLAENRAAALSNLTGARLQQLENPSLFQANLGQTLTQLANSRENEQQLMQQDRGITTQQTQNAQIANQNQSNYQNWLQMQGANGLVGALGGAASGLRGTGWSPSGLAKYLGGGQLDAGGMGPPTPSIFQ